MREAVEEERWDDADRYAALTAAALNAYSDRLDDGVRLSDSPQATTRNPAIYQPCPAVAT